MASVPVAPAGVAVISRESSSAERGGDDVTEVEIAGDVNEAEAPDVSSEASQMIVRFFPASTYSRSKY